MNQMSIALIACKLTFLVLAIHFYLSVRHAKVIVDKMFVFLFRKKRMK